ncbi:MAG: hypothetical protein R2822_22000 [Spirosomataceae bacterium]
MERIVNLSMMMRLLIILLFLWNGFALYAQNFIQTIKGRVVDAETRQPLVGATVVIITTSPSKEAITDAEGF